MGAGGGRWVKGPVQRAGDPSAQQRTALDLQQDMSAGQVPRASSAASRARAAGQRGTNCRGHLVSSGAALRHVGVLCCLQRYEGAYLLVEGCCAFINPCWPTSESGSHHRRQALHACHQTSCAQPRLRPQAAMMRRRGLTLTRYILTTKLKKKKYSKVINFNNIFII